MWDHYTVTPNGTPDVHVTIKQQPNDAADAARLYGELVSKAEAEVAQATLEKFGVNNTLHVMCVDTQRNYMDEKQLFRFLFKLNDQVHDIAVAVGRTDTLSTARYVFMEALAKALVSSLTTELLRKI